MQTLLVAGATGYLGGFIVSEAKRRGYRVRALVRPGKTVSDADEVFEGEATRPETLAGLCDGVDAVFSSLGITRQADQATYMDVDYRANANVLAEAQAAGVGRFGVVSAADPERFTTNPLMEARERFVRDLQASGLPSTVVRSTGFFSDMEEFLAMARRGTVYLFQGEAVMNPIHGADLAVVVLDALEASEAEVVAGGPELLRYRQVAELAFAALDEPVRIRVVPTWLVLGLLWLVRPFSSRLHTIGAFMHAGSQADMLGDRHGTRHLAEHFRRLVAEQA
jgi:uncharacterized protein YbjT (DUF2867 family)